MTRWIMLSVAIAVFSGCKGDVSETSSKTGENASQSSSPTSAPTTSSPPASSAGYDSPAAVFAALQQAAADNDFPAAIKCLSPESQEQMAMIVTLPLAMMAAFDPDKEVEVKDLLTKHGISMEDESEEFPIKTAEGRVAYITDVMEWMEKNADSTDETPFKNMAAGSLGEVTIEDDAAHATVTLADNQTEEMEFRRIDGQWFLHPNLEQGFSSDGEMNIGGVESFGDSDFGGFGGDEEPPAPIEAVTLEQLDSAWQITLDVKNQPAGNLLRKLAEELGLKLDVDSKLENAFQKPVTVQIEEGSRFAAIEDIAQQLDLTPVYSAKSLSFENGKRTQPVIFSGPFVIAVKSFETYPETATGMLSLHAFTSGLPPAVMGLLNEGYGSPIEITAVTDKNDNELRREHGSGSVGMSFDHSAFDKETLIGLKNLLRNVETVSTLAGRISFSLPTKVEVIMFDELKPGAEQKAGEVTLKLTKLDGGSVTFEYNGTKNDNIHLLAFDKQGKRVESFGSSSFGSNNSGQMSQDYQEAPARMEARIVTQQETLKYEIRLPEIPVPNHSEMPEQLTELTFEGESPVSLKFDSVTGKENFRKIKFGVTNHANKDIETFSLTLSYLDADGKELKKSPTSHAGEIIPAKGATDIELSAFFMPENAKTVNAIVKTVEFTDATRWKPK